MGATTPCMQDHEMRLILKRYPACRGRALNDAFISEKVKNAYRTMVVFLQTFLRLVFL